MPILLLSIENEKTINQTVAQSLNQNGSIHNIFGQPIETQGKTIIPVARIAMGLGGGFGQGRKGKSVDAGTAGGGEGEGAGGGLYAIAEGVYEVSAKRTWFIPVKSSSSWWVGVALGFAVGWWRSRQKPAK